MRTTAALVVLAAAAAAFAQDEDPDLAVLSGKVAAGAPGNVRLSLRRLAPDERGEPTQSDSMQTATAAAGQEFRFAGLRPGPYVLTIEADGCATEERSLGVYADVANVDVLPVAAPTQQDASVAGKLTLGFDGSLADCAVRLIAGPIDRRYEVRADGSFQAPGLRAGAAWAIVDGTRTIEVPRDGEPPLRKSRSYRRIVPLTLAPGANPVELRVDSEEDVAAVIRSSTAGETVHGRVLDLDPTPFNPWTRTFRFVWPADGKPACWRWAPGLEGPVFGPAGPDLPLFAWAQGAHKLRVEAAGFEPLEQEVTVAGTTRLVLTLKGLPGDYAKPSIEGDAWWIEERGADGEWKLIASWESRGRPAGEGVPPVPSVFLAPGEHVLRGVRIGSAPSAPQKVMAGEGRVERGLAFVFPTGWTLRGSLKTASGNGVSGFRAYCFARTDEKLERERGHDFVAGLDFVVTGLTKGRHALAFDENGEHVFAEFDMGEKDVTREFVYSAR